MGMLPARGKVICEASDFQSYSWRNFLLLSFAFRVRFCLVLFRHRNRAASWSKTATTYQLSTVFQILFLNIKGSIILKVKRWHTLWLF